MKQCQEVWQAAVVKLQASGLQGGCASDSWTCRHIVYVETLITVAGSIAKCGKTVTVELWILVEYPVSECVVSHDSSASFLGK